MFSSRQWFIFILSSTSLLLSGMVYSLQAPFYPAEAEKHHLSPSQYGFVFGTFELASFIVSPLCGRFMNVLGPKFMALSGLLMTGSSTVIFGFLDKLQEGVGFLVYCLLCRVIEAIGQSATTTAIMSVIAHEFHDKTGTVISWTETFYGVGMMIGPSVGGALFELGGYVLPFIVVGVCLLLNFPFAMAVLPSDDELRKSATGRNQDITLTRVLCIPLIWVGLVTNAAGAISAGFLQATLEPHLRIFSLSWSMVGFIFLLNGMGYAASNPIWGKLCDMGFPAVTSMCLGILMTIFSFSLIGPLPFLPIEPNLAMVVIGLIITGFSIGAEFVPSYIHMNEVLLAAGLPDSVATHGIVSGLWLSSLTLGGFVGPTLGGFLKDHFGFRTGTVFIIGGNLVLLLCLLPVALYMNRKRKHKTKEESPLLHRKKVKIYNRGE